MESQSQQKTQRTNKDSGEQAEPAAAGRARRQYRLSPEGLASLRASAARVKPWERSTGPRTTAGRASSSQNAVKHGQRSAAAIQVRRDVTLLLAAL